MRLYFADDKSHVAILVKIQQNTALPHLDAVVCLAPLHGKDSHQLCRSGRNSVSGGAAYSAGAEVGTRCAAMGEMGPGSTRAAVAAAMSSRDRVACSNAWAAATHAP
jgi:hypothetical protein